jgi:hypothetical protein
MLAPMYILVDKRPNTTQTSTTIVMVSLASIPRQARAGRKSFVDLRPPMARFCLEILQVRAMECQSVSAR